MSLDVREFEEHFDRSHPELIDRMWEVADHLRQHCPVTHSDERWVGSVDGFWMVTDYEDVVSVFQDWRTYTTDRERMAEFGVEQILGNMPPMTTEPPIQRDFRQLLNPFLTPAAVAPFEPSIRFIVGELIDEFIGQGQCDLVRQFARALPGRITLRLLLDIDDEDELERVLRWTDTHTYELDSPAMSDATASLERWLNDFIATRRTQPRRDDIADAIIHGSVLGRSLTDEETIGAIKNVVFGGFITQTHLIAGAMLALVEHPELQDRLRRDPEHIPLLFDEVLRLDPPVMFESRTCTRNVELGGQPIKAGQQVVVHLGAANRDPSEFDRPAEVDIDRARNRHLSFGAGPHRCVGSNLARLNMRIAFEELLSRLHDIRITDGDAPRRAPSTVVWGMSYLPLTFTPAP
ncbi:MAG: cytochrome [Acidimicrobiales bacterium]|nr:cytochrome [Acidimicrobiales bacterium]